MSVENQQVTPSAQPWAPITVRAGIPEVEPGWVRDAPATVSRVDVREASELSGPLGAMDGARHVPLGQLAQEAQRWPDRHAPVVLFCRSGGRSGRAAEMLLRLGFTRVASMRGGMTAW